MQLAKSGVIDALFAIAYTYTMDSNNFTQSDTQLSRRGQLIFNIGVVVAPLLLLLPYGIILWELPCVAGLIVLLKGSSDRRYAIGYALLTIAIATLSLGLSLSIAVTLFIPFGFLFGWFFAVAGIIVWAILAAIGRRVAPGLARVRGVHKKRLVVAFLIFVSAFAVLYIPAHGGNVFREIYQSK